MNTGVNRGKSQATTTVAVNASQPKQKQAVSSCFHSNLLPPLPCSCMHALHSQMPLPRPKSTPAAPIPGLSGGREAMAQGKDPHGTDSEPPRNAGCTLQDLCPDDKQKVAKLLKQAGSNVQGWFLLTAGGRQHGSSGQPTPTHSLFTRPHDAFSPADRRPWAGEPDAPRISGHGASMHTNRAICTSRACSYPAAITPCRSQKKKC